MHPYSSTRSAESDKINFPDSSLFCCNGRKRMCLNAPLHFLSPLMLGAHQIANATSLSIALPAMGKDLNIPEQRLQWPLSAYSLSSVRSMCQEYAQFTNCIFQGCFLLLFGRIADLYGRKKVFTMGSLGLTVFSLGLGFANGIAFVSSPHTAARLIYQSWEMKSRLTSSEAFKG